jgi:hypothetical protein
MRPPLRIAVLECGPPFEKTKKKYGGYGGVFEALLKASTALLEGSEKIDPESELHVSKWDVFSGDQYPALEQIDAILITGSSKLRMPKELFFHDGPHLVPGGSVN